MQDKLIGYLLGALEVEETTCVEDVLQANTEARRQLEVLRIGLVPFDGDREDVDAPARLAIRTCQRIREVRDVHDRR